VGAIPHRAPGAVINNLKVLIVDDEADILRVISRVLRRAGLTVVTARSGEEALEVLSS
jgi:CheY-like chemotaxis protein